MEGPSLQTDLAQFGKVPIVIHVEACLADGVTCADYAALTEIIRQHLFRKGVVCSGATLNGALLVDLGDNAELSQLKYLCICERDTGSLQPFYFKGSSCSLYSQLLYDDDSISCRHRDNCDPYI